jgi:methyltransferase
VNLRLGALFLVWDLIVLMRIVELKVSRRNERALVERGGQVVGPSGLGLLVCAHVLWLLAWPVEVIGLATRAPAVWPALAVLAAAAEAMRLWTIATLGRRWTLRVVRLDGEPLVTGGPYRWLRHPNYVAVAAEVVLLPLAFGAWRSALVGLGLYLFGLSFRLPAEERALAPARSQPLDPRTTRP